MSRSIWTPALTSTLCSLTLAVQGGHLSRTRAPSRVWRRMFSYAWEEITARLVATLPPDGLALDDAAPDGGEAGFPSPPGRVGAAPPMQDPPSLSGAPSARSERFLSYQNKLSRIRKTRVHISYDVETVEAKVELELPFVMGVLGDFSGKPTRRLTPLRDRKFIQIDRDNFEAVMAGMTPGLEFRVANTLIGDGSELAMRLTFNSLEDFEPGGVVRQLEPLRKLCEARDNLRDLLTKVDRSDELENLLERIATSENDFKKLSEQLGVDSSKESESADGGSTVMIEDSPASLEKYLVQRRSSERHRHQAPQTAAASFGCRRRRTGCQSPGAGPYGDQTNRSLTHPGADVDLRQPVAGGNGQVRQKRYEDDRRRHQSDRRQTLGEAFRNHAPFRFPESRRDVARASLPGYEQRNQ